MYNGVKKMFDIFRPRAGCVSGINQENDCYLPIVLTLKQDTSMSLLWEVLIKNFTVIVI